MADNHTKTNPVLSRLSAFVGEWQWEASVAGQPIGRGPTLFEWLEGGAFLIEHSGAEQADFPSATTIISGDDSLETYCMLQVDSRGISASTRWLLTTESVSCGGTIRASRSDSQAGSVATAAPSAAIGRNQPMVRSGKRISI